MKERSLALLAHRQSEDDQECDQRDYEEQRPHECHLIVAEW